MTLLTDRPVFTPRQLPTIEDPVAFDLWVEQLADLTLRLLRDAHYAIATENADGVPMHYVRRISVLYPSPSRPFRTNVPTGVPDDHDFESPEHARLQVVQAIVDWAARHMEWERIHV